MDGDLKTVLISVQKPLHLQEIVLLEGVEGVLNVVPHLGFDLAGTVAQSERQIRLARLLGLHLLGYHHEAGCDDLVFLLGTIADEEIFHEPRIRENERLARVSA